MGPCSTPPLHGAAPGQGLRVVPLPSEHAERAAVLWRVQLDDLLTAGALPPTVPASWRCSAAPVATFVAARAQAGRALALMSQDQLLGYAAYDTFTFHGEEAAFVPVAGHAVLGPSRAAGYALLYHALAATWVGQRRLSHYLACGAADEVLQHMLFDYGFGLCVVDAFRGIQPVPVSGQSAACVVRATSRQATDLLALTDESRAYYAAPPLCLRRESDDTDALRALLQDPRAAVFLALAGGQPVGFMGVQTVPQPDPVTLRDGTVATLDGVGAYLQPAWRGQGLGARLLEACVTWSAAQGLLGLHVDFESANPLARPFWRRHFRPALHSLRRRLNQDAADPVAAP